MSEQRLPKSPFPHWLAFVLANPLRIRSTKPAKVVDEAGIKPGQTVLEIGCGPGVFTEFIAAKVGAGGQVIAQDVQAQMLNKLEKRRRRFTVNNKLKHCWLILQPQA